MFRKAFERRRCLVPADGFYEWQGAKPPKQPYFIHKPDDGQFAFAGLWERWKAPKDAEPLDTYTIITTRPNAMMATIHNRMRVILNTNDYGV
jgi:putative SOS response-associated peptidase YedK